LKPKTKIFRCVSDSIHFDNFPLVRYQHGRSAFNHADDYAVVCQLNFSEKLSLLV